MRPFQQIKKEEYGQDHFYVYILVRQDLSIAQQAVQSVHAAIEATKAFKQTPRHPSVIICSVEDEKALQKAIFKVEQSGIRYKAFLEPDIGNQMTAIATEPVCGKQRKVFKKFKLMNRGCTMDT